MDGYAGRILKVDLGSGGSRVEELPLGLAEEYIGGRGFAAKLLYDEVPKEADPLGPDNRVVVAAGPLSGLLVPGAGKTTFAAKSPATNGYADSNVGGHLSPAMKYAGYDAVVIRGISGGPAYLCIDDDRVEVRDASRYWGLGCFDAEERLKADLGEDFEVAVIGPAAEKLVKFACISHDYGRQAGRAGIGAVMGSKRLKAIAVRGTGGVEVADMEAYREFACQMFQACKESESLEVWQRYGTAGVTLWANEIGAFPTRNFRSGSFEGHRNLSGENMRERIVVTDKGCFACPSPCGKYSWLSRYGVHVEGPEYETTALFGGSCALSDIEDVAYANYLCDHHGLDTISTGNVIAFAIECFEKGVITREDTGGMDLAYGDSPSIFALIERIGRREGIGDLLAEGVRAASEKLGDGTADYAIQVKGLEVSGYESHNAPSMMLAYMTCDVGAHHNRAWSITYDIETGRDTVTRDKADKVIELQHIRPLFDCLGTCRLQWVEIGFPLELYPPMVRAVTGLDRSLSDLLHISERVWNLTRCFWIRENQGFGRSWDMPPARYWKDEMVDGPTQGTKLTLDQIGQLLDYYYERRGWDDQGIPTPEKLAELDLLGVVGEDLAG